MPRNQRKNDELAILVGQSCKKIGVELAYKGYVIIGNGAAGISAVEALRQEDADTPITIVSHEPCLSYSKVLLHHYIDGGIDENGLFIRSEEFYRDLGIKLVLGLKADTIDPDRHEIHLEDDSTIGFERLLIATGSRPWIPSISGIDDEATFTMWTLDDARRLHQTVRTSRSVVIVGGGFVGMHALTAMVNCGLKVTVVDIADRIMPQSLDSQSANLLRSHLEAQGVELFLDVKPTEIRDTGSEKALILEDGREVQGDTIIVATGSTPNIGPAENTPIAKNIGLLVDDYMRTNYKQIYAAGDVAEVTDFLTGQKRILGLWTAAFEQGRIAGFNMAGKRTPYLGGIAMNSIDVLGLSVVTIGDTLLAEDSNGFSKIVYANQTNNIYRKFLFQEEALVGAILVGYSEDAGIIHNIIKAQIKIDRDEGGFGFGSLRNRAHYFMYGG